MLIGPSPKELRDPDTLRFASHASTPLIVAPEDTDDGPDGVEVFSDPNGFTDPLATPLTPEQIGSEYFPEDRDVFMENAGLNTENRPFAPAAELYAQIKLFLEAMEKLSREEIAGLITTQEPMPSWGLRSLWSDLQRLPPRSLKAIVQEDEDRRNTPLIASRSMMIRQLTQEALAAPALMIRKLPHAIQHTLLSTLTAALITLSGYGFFQPKVWDDFVDKEEKTRLTGLDEDNRNEIFQNPISVIRTLGLKDGAAVDMLTKRVMEALFVQSEQENPPPPPDSLETLAARLRAADDTDSMVLLAPGHLPPDFWSHLDEEEASIIRKNVRYVIFAKDITAIFSDTSVKHRGYFIGRGLVVVDSRLAMTGIFEYQLGDLMIHEGTHAMNDHHTSQGTRLATLTDEHSAYEHQAAYLKRHLDGASGEQRTAIQGNYMRTVRALRTARFLEEHYADYPATHGIWNTHPGHGIQAAEFLRNGLKLIDLKPIETEDDYADLMYDMMAARTALEEYERVEREGLSTRELMEIARAYRDQHYRTGDMLDLLIADQLIGLYLHFHANEHKQDLDRDFDRQLRGEKEHAQFKGGSHPHLRQLQKVLPYEPDRVVPRYLDPCGKGTLSLEEALEEMLQNPAIIATLESELASSVARRYKTLKDVRYESYLLYRLGYYYMAVQDFERAEKYLRDYITHERNWHQDFETHVVMMRFVHYFAAHSHSSPENPTWKKESWRHWRAAQQLNPGSVDIYGKLFPWGPTKETPHPEAPFSYTGTHTPREIQRLMCSMSQPPESGI